ncbi:MULTISPECIES: LysR family transcriptional regulator ArgP [unclassified Halomonas]|uniref:LysR family transcriptional regulator ArgP n=1 Tax=unclassified Halomonas TaxID=2609666 RepID=UPI002076842B|nr:MULTISPECIES: LysR family transcriptional regulator ArgP [unclassified Halomonas]
MLDYKLLAALAAVVEQGGFERGARALGLTQSAVSQRIKLMEARLGQPVLMRVTPPMPTATGRRLLNHMQQVRLLERDLQARVPAVHDGAPQRLRIALNADSLATWWAEAAGDFFIRREVLMELIIEDQDVGLKRMRDGEVAGCVCAAERPVAGAKSIALGAMRYCGVAAPSFIERHFADGFDGKRLSQTPAIVFGTDDRLQHRFAQQLGARDPLIHHLCPSAEGFVKLLESGLGWGLVPRLQVEAALEQGTLLELAPAHPVDVALYWHYWRQGGELLGDLTRHLRQRAGGWLVAPAGA